MHRLSTTSTRITYDSNRGKYYVEFGGKTIETTVTDRAAVAAEWVREIRSKHAGESTVVVGLDNEWRPHPARHLSNKSATLQLCVDDKCLILQLFYADEIPEALKSFVSDTKFVFVGVEVADDVAKLRDEYGLLCLKSADVPELAKKKWPWRFSRPGLKDLAMEICGLYMPKPKHVCLSNWEARELTNAQIEYACIDAYASYEIGQCLIFGN